MKTVVIVGAGPGLGNHIGYKYASEGYQVVLVSRDEKKLEKYLKDFQSKGYTAYAQKADTSDEHSIKKAFEVILQKYAPVDTLVYNAANLHQIPIDQLTGRELTDHFKTDVAGALDCVNEVLPGMLKEKQGTILFTGGLLGVFPNANDHYPCISIDKAALRTLALMLNNYLEDKGVFAGIVNVMGNIGSSEVLSPERIAQVFWELSVHKESFEVNYPEVS